MDEALRWLKYVLAPAGHRPAVAGWEAVYRFARRQALVGVCNPARFGNACPDKRLLLEWIGMAEMIRGRNALVNSQCAVLFATLADAGFRCCMLKGQGNAMMYPDPSLRMPGDIDVWVDTDHETLMRYVASRFPQEKESFKHVKFPLFADTPVDLHLTPLKLYRPMHNRRLQQWFVQQKGTQFAHCIRLPGMEGMVAAPTVAFNAVYQLGHIMIHIMDEGIGLRQLVDYYYVLRGVAEFDDKSVADIVTMWRRVGMKRLAGAVMWVEHQVLGLPERFLPVSSDARLGRLLAEDIFDGGNFGHARGLQQKGRVGRKMYNAWHMLKLSACFPGEALFRLPHKVRHAMRIAVSGLHVRRWKV